MFRREEKNGIFLGYRLERAGRLYFFGSRFLSKEALGHYFPEYEFLFLSQVHGREVIAARAGAPQSADAHFTSAPGLALVSQSADCTPVLLASKTKVCAIHSGWRGTALNIAGAARAAFGSEPAEFAAIGPHILAQSFEIGRDLVPQLMGGAPPSSAEQDFVKAHPDTQKVYFDLSELIRRQLRSAFGSGLEIAECLEDTMTSPLFHSYRRDRERAGRQYSFVVINP